MIEHKRGFMMKERPSHQTLLSAPRGIPTTELISLLLGPFGRQYSWANTAIEQWALGQTGKRKALYIADETHRTTLHGEFDRDEQERARFHFEIAHSPEVGLYWTAAYVAVVTKKETILYERVTFESTEPVFVIPEIDERLILPLKSAVASGRFNDAGYPVISGPHTITENVDIQMLVNALNASDRQLPIVIMAENNQSPRWPVDPKELAKHLEGIAHVVSIVDKMTYMLTDILGKSKSVYQGYTKIYPKNTTNERSILSFSPNVLREKYALQKLVTRVRETTLKDDIIPPQIPMEQNLGSMIRFVPEKQKNNVNTYQSHKNAIEENLDNVPAFQENPINEMEDYQKNNTQNLLTQEAFDELASSLIGRLDKRINRAVENALQKMEEDFQKRDLKIEEIQLKISNLQKEITKTPIPEQSKNEGNLLAPNVLNNLQAISSMLNELASGVAKQEENTSPKIEAATTNVTPPNSKKEKLEIAVLKKEENTATHEYPKSLEPQYVEKFLQQWPGRIALHPKAIESLKNAKYEKPQKVYAVLEALATNYVSMRRGEDQSGQAYAQFTKSLHDLSLRFEAYKQDRSGTYQVIYQGKQRRVEYAVKSRNAGLDKRRCLRIYLLWDEENKQVVLINLPGHLQQQKEIT